MPGKARRSRALGLLVLAVAASLLLTGCWDLEEIENRGMVLSLGVDLTQDGKFLVSVQMPRPQALNYARGQATGAPTEQFLTVTGTGETVWAALSDVDRHISRRLYLGQVQTIVLGEALARQGVGEVLDTLMRNATVNRQARMLLTKDAKSVVEQPTVGELLPAFYFSTFFDTRPSHGTTAEMVLWRLFHDVALPCEATYVPIVTPEDSKFDVNGLGLIASNRLVAEVKDEMARGISWAATKVAAGTIVIHVEGKTLTLRVQGSRHRITEAWWEDGNPRFQLAVEAQVSVAEEDAALAPMTPELRKAVETAAAEVIKQETDSALQEAIRTHADVFGFGEALRVAQPGRFQGKTWPDKFGQAKVDVKVSVESRSRSVLR